MFIRGTRLLPVKMPPFIKKYKLSNASEDSSSSGGNDCETEELIVETTSAVVATSEIQPHDLHLVPTLSTPFPELDTSLPDNRSIPSNSTMMTDGSGSSSAAPKARLRMSFDFIANFIPHFDGKPSSINNFISQCRLADSLVGPEDKIYLLALIRNRMQKRDYSRIIDGQEPGTVGELIDLIKAAYEQSFDIKSTRNEFKKFTSERTGNY